MGSLGPWQIVIIVLVIALLFGAKKLPQIGKGMGEALRNFKKSVNDVDSTITDITPDNNQMITNKKEEPAQTQTQAKKEEEKA